MSLILAIEPDARQSTQLADLVRRRLGADLVHAPTTEEALAALAKVGDRVPDLVLVPSLLSAQEDAAIAGALRIIAAAANVRMLTIPMLADPEQSAGKSGGMFARLRGRKAKATTGGCDPDVFADQIATYLAEAAAEKKAAREDLADQQPAVPIVSAVPPTRRAAKPVVSHVPPPVPVEPLSREEFVASPVEPTVVEVHQPIVAFVDSPIFAVVPPPNEHPFEPPVEIAAPMGESPTAHVPPPSIESTPQSITPTPAVVEPTPEYVPRTPQFTYQPITIRPADSTIDSVVDRSSDRHHDVPREHVSVILPPKPEENAPVRDAWPALRAEAIREVEPISAPAPIEEAPFVAAVGASVGSAIEPPSAAEPPFVAAQEEPFVAAQEEPAAVDPIIEVPQVIEPAAQSIDPAVLEAAPMVAGAPSIVDVPVAESAPAAMLEALEEVVAARPSVGIEEIVPAPLVEEIIAAARVVEPPAVLEPMAALEPPAAIDPPVGVNAAAEAQPPVAAKPPATEPPAAVEPPASWRMSRSRSRVTKAPVGRKRLFQILKPRQVEPQEIDIDALIAPLLSEMAAKRRTPTKEEAPPAMAASQPEPVPAVETPRAEPVPAVATPRAEPVPVTETPREPAPVRAVETQPQPSAVPEPTPAPEPLRVAEPTPEPEPVRVPEPAPEPEPLRVAEPTPEPEPLRVEPTPEPEPLRVAEPTPEPREPLRLVAPAPRRQRKHQPAPVRVPEPTPAPEPVRAVEPVALPDPVPFAPAPAAMEVSASPVVQPQPTAAMPPVPPDSEIDPMFFADDALTVPPPTPAQAERSAWIELVESLRQDIERLKAERGQGAAPEPAPAPPPVEEPLASPAARPMSSIRRKPAAPPPQPQPQPSKVRKPRRPVEDQWGLFDPEQCGFAALLAKLDEIQARDEVSA